MQTDKKADRAFILDWRKSIEWDERIVIENHRRGMKYIETQRRRLQELCPHAGAHVGQECADCGLVVKS
jgi:hypothetical protein